MPIIDFSSKTGTAASPGEGPKGQHEGDPSDPLDVMIPAEALHPGAEEYRIEIAPLNANGMTIALALKVKPGIVGGNPATSRDGDRGVLARNEERTMAADGKANYGGYRARTADMFLADVDLFLDRNPTWGEISLLRAGGNDHRIIAKVKAGDGFRITTLEDIAETMNKAERGELNPDEFRNTSAQAAARSAARSESEGSGPSNPKSAPHGRKKRSSGKSGGEG